MPERLAVIVPALDAAATLDRCLSAIAASTRRPDEIILFDDGSVDGTGAIARRHGVKVLRNEGPPRGPAVARNAAASATEADLLIFVDSDVIVHPEAIEKLERAIIEEPGVIASFGSYDERPPARRWAGRYANLRHHFFHQLGNRRATTFWAGLGAFQRRAFLKLGGFDPRYRQPSIEDVELGIRAVRSGYQIRLVHDAQGAHCKDWTNRQLWQSDIFRRAVPWTELIATGQTKGGDLNLVPHERAAAAAAHAVWLNALVVPLTPWALVPTGAAALLYLWLNREFLRLLARSSLQLAVRGAGYHWLYHVYASTVFVTIQALVRLRPAAFAVAGEPEAKGQHRKDPNHT